MYICIYVYMYGPQISTFANKVEEDVQTRKRYNSGYEGVRHAACEDSTPMIAKANQSLRLL